MTPFLQLYGATMQGPFKPTRSNDQSRLDTAKTAEVRLQVCLSRICHTGIKSFLTGKTSHVKPSPCGACPEGRRTRVTQWLETKDKDKTGCYKRDRAGTGHRWCMDNLTRQSPSTSEIHTFSSPRQRRLSSYSACRSWKGFCTPGRVITEIEKEQLKTY